MISFIKGWLLALVMLSSIPPLAITGAVMAVMIEKMASHGQTAYAEAGVIVEQTIGSIRTVGHNQSCMHAPLHLDIFFYSCINCLQLCQ